MPLELLPDGWKRFSGGIRWRCSGPSWFCEVEQKNNIPSYSRMTSTLNEVRRVREFYRKRTFTAMDDWRSTLADILTANALAESSGTVPTPFSRDELETVLERSGAATPGGALDELLEYIRTKSASLVRKEPGYEDPVATPGRVSVGAHHMLLATGLDMQDLAATTGQARADALARLAIGLAADSVFAAELALTYFNRKKAIHNLEPPLMAAVYNAGSLRQSQGNPWHLVQFGDHIDRWVAFYNTSRSLAPPPGNTASLEMTLVRKEFTEQSTIGELYIDGTFHCYTLEDKVRPDGIKIYGETAIPEGRYEVKVSVSQRFQKEMPELLKVPGFAGIRIHGGNTAADTLGCILVGRCKSTDRISECKPVFESLLGILKATLPAKNCFITIRS